MALTPEERQRIYEEEKVRIEAQDRIKAEKRGKTFGGVGIGCVVIFGIFVLLWIVATVSEEAKTPEQRAMEAAESCVKNWQLKLIREGGYSYEEGKIESIARCSAEIERWHQLKK